MSRHTQPTPTLYTIHVHDVHDCSTIYTNFNQKLNFVKISKQSWTSCQFSEKMTQGLHDLTRSNQCTWVMVCTQCLCHGVFTGSNVLQLFGHYLQLCTFDCRSGSCEKHRCGFLFLNQVNHKMYNVFYLMVKFNLIHILTN